MDEKITDVLAILDREDSPSQREIAKQIGFSVGLVNTLIKKCAKKGLIKIERLNSRNIKYILTSEGMKEKTKKTINYIKKSYQAIQQLQNRVTELALQHSAEGKNIYVYEEEADEIFDLVTDTLNELNIDYEIIDSENKLKEINKKNSIVYYWSTELNFSLNNINSYNIINLK